MTFVLPSADALRAFGFTLGRFAVPGTVLALRGDLGAGKTTLVQGLAEGLGIAGPVPSPTFVLVCRYDDGRLTLWHSDLYRVEDQAALDQLALDEAFDGGGVVAVEWPDRFPDLLPADHMDVLLEHDERGRRLTATATGARHRALLERLP